MSAHPLPPNPCLVAILLVVRTSSDPSIVFHYPPKPGEDNSRFKDLFRDDNPENESSTSSSSEDSPGSSTEGLKVHSEFDDSSKKHSPPEADVFGSASPEKSNELRSRQKWNDLFGYQSPVLAKLLTPAATGNKKRFEVGLGEKVMLGRPVFAKSDGLWKKAKKMRRSSSRSNLTSEKAKNEREDLEGGREKIPGTRIQEKDFCEASVDDQSDAHDEMKPKGAVAGSSPSVEEREEVVEKKSKRISNMSATSHVAKKPLKFFHVVYVLQPPPLEYRVRVSEMYDHIVRKFSKAMKWEQSRSNYVANEASLISSVIKATERLNDQKHFLSTLYREVLAQSSLAKAISNLYNSISNLRIAQLNLTPSTSLSLQIPVATSISVLPTPLLPQLPGLWLTTANSMPTDDGAETTGTQLGSHFTLLLLSDLHSILADVNATSSPITDALTHYLRVSTPTKSFYQISQSSSIPLHDIQFLASHLIYWRRARAMPPLHQRDTYIVSPNADMRKLSSAASVFAKNFPALPTLPQILSVLSSRTRPYSSLIPSKDHKPAYMDILAWLMRGGWVTQLRTFAWVRVPSHIKELVGNQNPQDKSGKSLNHSTTDNNESSLYPEPFTNPSHAPSLIPNPGLASDLPSQHLSAISKHILEIQGADSHSAWVKCVRYFDGRHALETIPVREGWKRKRVKELLDGWVEAGVLVIGRHW